jgi:hypothetical protein
LFHPLVQQVTQSCVQFLPTKFSVVELGNQTFVGNEFDSVREWYMHLGASSYLAIDTNTKKDAIIADLNYDIQDQIGGGQFDLITNNGTSEHLFNQAQVFQNIHNLCVCEGIMLHIVPLTPWINHGFYNYNPIFFRDLSRVNEYEILFFKLADRWGHTVEVKDYDELFKEKHPKGLTKAIQEVYSKARYDVFNVTALRKKKEQGFKIPMQGKYVKDIEGDIPSE